MLTYDSIVPIYKNKTVYILGGGESLNSIISRPDIIKQLQKKAVIGVNRAMKLGDWVKVMYFGDVQFYHWFYRDIWAFKGEVYTHNIECASDHKIRTIKEKQNEYGICTEPDTICWNGNSGAAAVNLAYHLGASKVVLLGYDMNPHCVQSNWHNDYPEVNTEEDYKIEIHTRFKHHFQYVAKDAETIGLQIVNANTDSQLGYFPKMTIDEILKHDKS